ncbi:hypothetical protein C8R45DRAFT_1166152 [Mycena sanguinolenta]|nr:hypothetical protein C8R45DRAFT_1166152 [Mycena sanguinolenta]
MVNLRAFFFSALVAVVSTEFAVLPTSSATASPATSPSIEVCTSSSAGRCATIAVVSTACVNLTGRLGWLNKNISTAIIPDGFVCTFFQRETSILANFRCASAAGTGNASDVVLPGGNWNFCRVPGLDGMENFSDLTSSFTCSPIV